MTRVVLFVDRANARGAPRALADPVRLAGASPPGAGVRRLAAAAILASVAIAIALLAAHARNLGASLLARATSVGDVPGALVDPSDAAVFAPFAFGVVGPVRGDAGALARSVEALAARGDVRFVVLLGPLLRDDDGADAAAAADETDVLRIAAAVRDRGVPVVAVPAASDLVAARDLVQAHVGAARWWFLHRECAIVGLPGGDADGDARFIRDRLRPSAPPRATIVLTSSETAPPLVADLVLHAEPGVRVVRVADAPASPGDPAAPRAVVSVETIDVATGPTPRTLARDVSLGVLFPIVRGTAGYAAVLAGAALLLAAALHRATPRGRAWVQDSPP